MATINPSTVSITNSPQAIDDTFTSVVTSLTEDYLQIVCLTVMEGDLGGNAKTLYSLDDGTSVPTDLLAQDTIRAEATISDFSASGTPIWIAVDGTRRAAHDAAPRERNGGAAMTRPLAISPDAFELLEQLDTAVWSSPMDGCVDHSGELDALCALGLVERYQRPAPSATASLYRRVRMEG